MSFLRHGKIYRSDGLRGKLNWLSNFPATIVSMSLQPAIPSWVALQQSPCPLRRSCTASLFVLLLYSHQQPTATCPYFSVSTEGSTPVRPRNRPRNRPDSRSSGRMTANRETAPNFRVGDNPGRYAFPGM